MSGGSDYGAGNGVTAGDGGVAGMIGVAQEAEKGDKNALSQLLKNGLTPVVRPEDGAIEAIDHNTLPEWGILTKKQDTL